VTAETVIEKAEAPTVINMYLWKLTPYADNITLRHPCDKGLNRPDKHRILTFLEMSVGKSSTSTWLSESLWCDSFSSVFPWKYYDVL